MLKGYVALRVTKDGYVPIDEEGKAQHSKLRVGQVIAGRIWRSRSLAQWRLFWGILTYVAEATHWETPRQLYVNLKARLGFFEPVKTPSGQVIVAVDSGAFDAMPQDEAQELFDGSMRVICEEIIPGMDRDDLIVEVQANMQRMLEEDDAPHNPPSAAHRPRRAARRTKG